VSSFFNLIIGLCRPAADEAKQAVGYITHDDGASPRNEAKHPALAAPPLKTGLLRARGGQEPLY
jgi:hypothetical protein